MKQRAAAGHLPANQTARVAGRPSLMGQAIAGTLQRARALYDLGEFGQAQRLYEGILAIEPNNVEALHVLGLCYDKAGDPGRAEPLLARSLQLDKRYAWAYVNHASVLVKLDRHEEALTAVRQALRVEPRNVLAFICRGNALLGLAHYAEAQVAYEQAIALNPGFAEAWSNRGNVLRALNRPADALISFNRALEITPHDFATHTNRAHALRDLGSSEEALRSYRLALVIKPGVQELHVQCGRLLLTLGRDTEALEAFEAALAEYPDDVDLLYLTCVALDLMHAFAPLLERCDRILSIDPAHAGAWLGRGNALQGQHRHAEATEAYRQALTHDPHLRTALNNQGVSLRMLGRLAEVLESYDTALAKLGGDPQLLCSRAQALQLLGRYDEALAAYEAAADAEPADELGWNMRATALQEVMRHDEALECYRHIQEHGINRKQAHYSEAFCLLMTGDLERGLEKYEYRWLDGEMSRARRHADRAQWTGKEPIAGKTILLHAEQGYGDTLQFCRYASLVAAQGARVLLEVPRALKTLIASLRDISGLFVQSDPLPDFDLQCPLLSVPWVLGTRLQTIPAELPYLYADDLLARRWAQRLDEAQPFRRLTVGVAWSGNPTHNNDHNRSVPLEMLAPLFPLDATFVSLQQQVRESDTAALAASGILHFGAELRDFSETAALVQAMDLVISVDTSVAHLAGALGKPLWVMLPRVPDWRWLLVREDSPWYPQARLFRQGKPGDWPELVERVAQALASKTSTGVPQTQY